jgi:protein-S-isoprenylcysteine O-methyltransferase Ste14
MREWIERIIFIPWVAMFGLWAVTGRNLKQTAQSRAEGVSRLCVWVVWIGWWLLFARGFGIEPLSWQVIPATSVAAYLGFVFTMVGLSFAIWARLVIGKNWSRLIHVKHDHELMQSGPYRIVRHPIYAGLMLATLGTAIAYALLSGFVGFFLVVVAWGYKARLEESVMLEQFGHQYHEYRQQVKGLIPWVW